MGRRCTNLRVLIASNVYPPNFIGGAELIAHQQARELQSRGHEVLVFAGEAEACQRRHATWLDEWEGIPLVRIGLVPGDYRQDRLFFQRYPIEDAFRALLESFRPDVVHLHNLIGLSAALPRLAKAAGVPTVVTLHDHWGFCFKNTLLKQGDRVCEDFSRCGECLPMLQDDPARRVPIRMRTDYLALALGQADALVSPSRYLAEAYVRAGFARDRLRVLPNGVDLERFAKVRRAPGGAELRLSFVGGSAPHKGGRTLFDALALLPRDSRLRVNFVGRGAEGVAGLEMVGEAGRRDWVRFWGRVDHDRMEEVYAETDVLMVPSIWPENQPVTITEALACGIPVIASHLGGNPELVQDRVNGRIFRAGDAGDLARCIGSLLHDPGRRARLAAAARRSVEHLSIEASTDRLESLYDGLATTRPATPPRRLVLCSGDRLMSSMADVLEAFPATVGWRFVMREWVDEELAAAAWLSWSVDRDHGQGAEGGAEAGGGQAVPRLVRLGCPGPVRDVLAEGSGLFHSSAEQARAVLDLLDRDENLYERLRLGARNAPGLRASKDGVRRNGVLVPPA